MNEEEETLGLTGAIVTVLIGFTVLFSVVQIYLVLRDWHLKRSRIGESFETFRSSFSDEQIPEEILLHVYRYFRDWKGGLGFPVRASDSIIGVYGIVDEDFVDMIDHLEAECGSGLPDNLTGVTTVGDLVRLLHQYRK